MKNIYGVVKDAELARALEISPQTLSSWRQRSAVPYALCVECAKTQGASLDWLLYGEGQMLRDSASQTKTLHAPYDQTQNELRGRVTEALEGLSQDDLEDILSEAQNRQRLRALEQRFEQLQAQFFDADQQAS